MEVILAAPATGAPLDPDLTEHCCLFGVVGFAAGPVIKQARYRKVYRKLS